MGRHRKLSFLFYSRYGENMNKGFTLTLSMVIVLIFMTTILTIETQKISIEEETHSQHAKLRAINSILLDLNSPAFDYSLSRMGKRAMFNVINEQISDRMTNQNNGYLTNAQKAICEEFKNNFEEYLSLSLRTRLNDTGLSIEYEKMECEVELINATHVNLTTSADLIFIEENKIEIKKSISLNSNFSIEGLPDPMLAIESFNANEADLNQPIIRPILLSPLYNDTENWDDGNLIIEDNSLLYAKGWVYGKVVDYESDDTDDVDYQKEVRGNILLIPDDLSQTDLQIALDFATSNASRGVIIDKNLNPNTKDNINVNLGGCVMNYTITEYLEIAPCIDCGSYGIIRIQQSTCAAHTCATFGLTPTDCEEVNDKLFYYSKLSPSSISYSGVYAVGSYDFDGLFDTGYVLIDEVKEREIKRANEAKAYNIERQRSATLCGNYFLSDSAPNIFSRMEGNLNENDKYGIETFILGTWVLNEDNSKLDHEYYNDESGVYVKGMLGCKDAGMCESDFPNIGRFAISGDNLEKYGMEDIEYD